MITFVYINSKGFSRTLCLFAACHILTTTIISITFLVSFFFCQFENSYLKNVLYVGLSRRFCLLFFLLLNYSSFVVHLKFNLNILVVQCHIHVRKIKLKMHHQMQTVWTKLWYSKNFGANNLLCSHMWCVVGMKIILVLVFLLRVNFK